jgi:hypothetical protein
MDLSAIIQAQEAFESLRTLGDKSPYATLLLSSAVARNKDSGPLSIGLLNRVKIGKGGKRQELGLDKDKLMFNFMQSLSREYGKYRKTLRNK